MAAEKNGEVRIDSEMDIVSVRKKAREVCASMGFGTTDVTRIVTAASELARNVYVFARTGTMRCKTLNKDNVMGVEFVFIDQGPGIVDIKKALEMGFTTGKGLGMGLPGAKRLMDEMDVYSEKGKGTTVAIRKWLRKP